jgi:hypothetical protein
MLDVKGASFLVLELVQGETLADRIKAGPIPIEEALKLGLQIGGLLVGKLRCQTSDESLQLRVGNETTTMMGMLPSFAGRISAASPLDLLGSDRYAAWRYIHIQYNRRCSLRRRDYQICTQPQCTHRQPVLPRRNRLRKHKVAARAVG